MKALIPFVAMLLATTATAQIHGRVYVDSNRNGAMDSGERPAKSVAVSDGRNVVSTDAEGVFELPSNADARFVFITTPSGYRNLSRHYIAVGKGVVSYDFPIVAREVGQSKGFDIIQIADTETSVVKKWADNIRDWATSNATQYIIHTGDICYEKGLNNHGRNIRSEHLGPETLYCVGNHDLVDGDYGEQLWERNFGPAWYSFDAGNVHFIIVPMLGGDRKPSYKIDEIIRWMRADLAKVSPSKRVAMFDHDLWFQNGDLVIRSESDSLDMSRHNLEAFVYGHWHSHFAQPVGSAMTYCSSTPDKGGIDHGPSCFRVLHFDADGKVSSTTRYTYIDGKLTSVNPASGETVSAIAGRIPIRVNAYRTVSPTKSVRVALENGNRPKQWTALTPDTDWAWGGSVAAAASAARLVVEAEFEDGTRLTERVDFKVSGDLPVVTPDTDWGNLAGNAEHNMTAAGSAASPRLVWSAGAGGNIWMVSPVVAGGRVFTATMDDDNFKKCFVVAYDAASGRELWRYKTDNSLKGTIVCDDNNVVACDATGVAYALDAATGKLKWRTQTVRPTMPPVYQGSAIVGDIVYVGQNKGLTALRLADGSPIWQNENPEPIDGQGTTSTITVGEGVVLSSRHWVGLFAHDASTGKLLWQNKDSNVRFRDGSAVIYDGNIYLASTSQMMLINPRSGDILKSVAVDEHLNAAAAPVVTDKLIYVATSDRGVVALDRLTFKKVWSFVTMPPIFYSVPYNQDSEFSVECTPLLVGETLVFGASDGYLYGVNAADGTTQWKRNVGSPIFSSPAISGDAMYISDFAGNVMCFKVGL